MKAFHYQAGQLHCEGVRLAKLAERFGTPLYVYSHNHIVGQWQALDRALAPLPHLVCYAVKANSNLAVLQALARVGAGFDLVSGGELERVLQAGGDPSRCAFAGVGKTVAEIERALQCGIGSFNVESTAELVRIDAVARRLGKIAPIALRVNPGVDPDTHHYISTGKHESKFGIPLAQALAVYRQAARMAGLVISGVQMHIGSQITKVAPYVLAIRKMLPLLAAVRELAPQSLQFFDIGGGLGISYRNERPPTARQFAAAIKPLLRRLGLRIVLEPGRSIVGNGGVLLTRVQYLKQTPVKRFVIVDAAMNDLIRPSLYGSYHQIVPVRQQRRPSHKVDVVGPVCESGDFLAQQRPLPAVAAGELLAVLSAGAYGMAMASNYNTRPRPAEVLVQGRRARLVRRRESIEDMLGPERL